MSSSGTLLSRLSYNPYGVTTVVSGTVLPTFQYAGMYWHQTSGLYLTSGGDGKSTGRFYDTATGRWGGRDPIEERGGSNLYGYVLNNPISFIDPFGTDIYLSQGNSNAPYQPPNYLLHQNICVDTWDDKCCKTGRRCFSFALSGFGFAMPSNTWLGDPSPNLGGPGRGTVYDSTGCEIWDVKTLKTTCAQDKQFLKMLEAMEGKEDTYSLGRHSCRGFSQSMFNKAQGMYNRPTPQMTQGAADMR